MSASGSVFVVPTGETIHKKAVLYLLSFVQVASVVAARKVTPIPFAPEFVSGLVPWNGMPIPFVDLNRCLLGASTRVQGNRQAVLACRVGGEPGERHVAISLPEGAQLMKQLPTCRPVRSQEYETFLDLQYAKGIFLGESDLFVVPNLARFCEEKAS